MMVIHLSKIGLGMKMDKQDSKAQILGPITQLMDSFTANNTMTYKPNLD